MQWGDVQHEFAVAVRDASREIPAPLARTKSGLPRTKGFSVYRNTHALSLMEALQSRFPVVVSLIGADCFRTVAQKFVQAHPPETPVLLEYGHRLPSFLAKSSLSKDLPFLKDIARLEWSVNESCHARDAENCSFDAIAMSAHGDPALLTLGLHPSLRLILSSYPVVSIWRAHQGRRDKVDLSNIAREPEYGCTIRSGLDVRVLMLTSEAYRFIAALAEHASIGAAVEQAGIEEARVLSGLLTRIFQEGLVECVGPGPENQDRKG